MLAHLSLEASQRKLDPTRPTRFERGLAILAILFCALLLAVPAGAQEPPAKEGSDPSEEEATKEKAEEKKPVTDEEAAAALEKLRTDFERDDFDLPVLLEHHREQALLKIIKLDHPDIADELLDHVKSDFKKVQHAALEGLANQSRDARAVSRRLQRMFDPGDEDAERLALVIRAIGKLGPDKMGKEFVKLFGHKSDDVVFAAVAALGDLGDKKMLPKLQELYKLNGTDVKGVSVRVDTGTAGNADRARARAAGKRQQAMIRRDRKEMARVMNIALTKLCETKIASLEELEAWMAKNKRIWR